MYLTRGTKQVVLRPRSLHTPSDRYGRVARLVLKDSFGYLSKIECRYYGASQEPDEMARVVQELHGTRVGVRA